ncbi:MAG: dipeptidase [Pirellula sp.]|jgi:membrane dipeptidase|nr:dipeptidase [Pirellula sp.]
MWIFDAHLDLALNGVDWNRDLRQSVDDLRAQEITQGMTDPGRQHGTLSLPELRQTQVAVCLTTLLARQEMQIDHSFGWTSPHACYAMAHAHLAYYRALEQDGYLKILKTKDALTQHWQTYTDEPQRAPLGFILTMEGADPLLRPDTIREFHGAGLRALGLTHYGTNRYGGGTRSEVGLSLDAIDLLKLCEELGVTIDMTHLSDVAFWQVAKHFKGRIHASHQNARAICNWQRQFSDDQIRWVIERDGVLGVSMDVIMLEDGFVRGRSLPKATLDRAVDQMDHIRSLSGGSVRHIGLGTDLDGGYGYEQTPADLNRYRDLQKLIGLMQRRGYNQSEIEAVFHGNWLRFFSEILP